jgi:GNAT superfamily N-acetyltransferase
MGLIEQPASASGSTGVGRRLVAAAEEALVDRGARRIAAALDGDDPEAVAFWRGVGYAPEGASARFVRDVQPPRS